MALFSLDFLLLGTASLLQLNWYYVQRDRAFPLITDFGEEWASSFVRFNNATLLGSSVRESDEYNSLLRLSFELGKYPGVSIIELEKTGWFIIVCALKCFRIMLRMSFWFCGCTIKVIIKIITTALIKRILFALAGMMWE